MVLRQKLPLNGTSFSDGLQSHQGERRSPAAETEEYYCLINLSCSILP